MVRITRDRKVYVGGYRLHHGRVGVWLFALGFALIVDDWADRPWPWRDE